MTVTNASTLRLMCVLAHPDDESLATGGVLAQCATEGVDTYLLTATRGERGRFGDGTSSPGPDVVGRAREVCRQPRHPYTASLVAAATPPGRTTPWAVPILGEVPHGLGLPAGCTFHPRCPYVHHACQTQSPPLTPVAPQRQVACHLSTTAAGEAWPPPLP